MPGIRSVIRGGVPVRIQKELHESNNLYRVGRRQRVVAAIKYRYGDQRIADHRVFSSERCIDNRNWIVGTYEELEGRARSGCSRQVDLIRLVGRGMGEAIDCLCRFRFSSAVVRGVDKRGPIACDGSLDTACNTLLIRGD